MADPDKFFIISSLAYGDFPQVRKHKVRRDHCLSAHIFTEDLDLIVVFLIAFSRVKSYILIDKLVNMELVLVLMKNQLTEVMGKVKSNLKINIKD